MTFNKRCHDHDEAFVPPVPLWLPIEPPRAAVFSLKFRDIDPGFHPMCSEIPLLLLLFNDVRDSRHERIPVHLGIWSPIHRTVAKAYAKEVT